jgi:hypothetical protein
MNSWIEMRGSSAALPIMNERGLADKMVWKTEKRRKPVSENEQY